MKLGWFPRGGLGTLPHPSVGTSPLGGVGGEVAGTARLHPPGSSYEGSVLVLHGRALEQKSRQGHSWSHLCCVTAGLVHAPGLSGTTDPMQ